MHESTFFRGKQQAFFYENGSAGEIVQMKKKLRLMLEVLIVVLGNALYAFSVVAFVKPTGLITGGTTGIALFVNKLFGMNLSLFSFLINGAMFLLGFFVLGKKFAATTALSTVVYPMALELWQHVLPAQGITQDVLLCTVFGGLFIGCGIALTMRVGASTGGMDIPPLIVNKFFRIPVAVTLYACDMVVLMCQAVYSTWEQVLYGILMLIVYTMTLNKALLLGKSMVEIKVVSEKVDEIRRAILLQVDRSSTLLHSRTGYMLKETEMLLSVVSSRELAKAEKLIHEIDPNAFMIVSRVTEVAGRGFSLKKQYIKTEA